MRNSCFLCVLLLFRKSSRLQREGKASSGKQQAGTVHYSVVSLQRAPELFNYKEVFRRGGANTISKLTKTVSVAPDVPDEVEGSSTPKRSRFNLQSREGEEEEEDSSVRRSSRITRYKLDSRRNQSVLYDRLITKWVLQHLLQLLLAPTSPLQFKIKLIYNLKLYVTCQLTSTQWAVCKVHPLIVPQHCWSCSPEDGRHEEDETQTEEQR